MAKKKQLRPKRRIAAAPKKCAFCEDKKEPWFSDVEPLQRQLTERGKITGRSRNGLCAKHQRRMNTAVKYARQLALLPYLSRE